MFDKLKVHCASLISIKMILQMTGDYKETELPQRSKALQPPCAHVCVSQETKRCKRITTQLHVCHFLTLNHLDDLI